MLGGLRLAVCVDCVLMVVLGLCWFGLGCLRWFDGVFLWLLRLLGLRFAGGLIVGWLLCKFGCWVCMDNCNLVWWFWFVWVRGCGGFLVVVAC